MYACRTSIRAARLDWDADLWHNLVAGVQQTPKASDMYKLHRSKFLHLLCTELHRIEATITAALPGIWNSMQGEEGHPKAQNDILGFLARSEKVRAIGPFLPRYA